MRRLLLAVGVSFLPERRSDVDTQYGTKEESKEESHPPVPSRHPTRMTVKKIEGSRLKFSSNCQTGGSSPDFSQFFHAVLNSAGAAVATLHHAVECHLRSLRTHLRLK